MGLLGVFVQSTLLKLINECLGERRVIILSFGLGVISNSLFGLAQHKRAIFVGGAISPFVNMAFPTISAVKSNNVDESEQGQVQGALYSLQALAMALGPVSMRFVARVAKNFDVGGPGSMFVFAAFLYVIAVCCGYFLPVCLFLA